MKLYTILSILGTWILVLPFLGFPSTWKTIFMVLSGLILLYLAYNRYQHHSSKHVQKENHATFTENDGTSLSNNELS